MEREVKNFLEEYEKLCQKYKMGLVGCGCCGSPQLVDEKGFTIYDNVNYEYNETNIGYTHWRDKLNEEEQNGNSI